VSVKEWKQHEVHWLEERFDRRDNEISKSRPWSVLSLNFLHDEEIFIACPNSTAPRLHNNTNLFVPAPEVNARIDLQQIWTFPAERAVEQPKQGELSSATINLIKSKLLSHLSREQNKSAYIGKIFWVDFTSPNSVTNAKKSDLWALKTALLQLGEAGWQVPHRAQISCLCIASDEFETDADGKKSLPLVTLVPLLHLPTILSNYTDDSGNSDLPTVVVPNESKIHPGQKRIALTQCVFTVNRGNGRIFQSGEKGMLSWSVKPRELLKIRTEVKEWLGIIEDENFKDGK